LFAFKVKKIVQAAGEEINQVFFGFGGDKGLRPSQYGLRLQFLSP
jgi:hypothetical protein